MFILVSPICTSFMSIYNCILFAWNLTSSKMLQLLFYQDVTTWFMVSVLYETKIFTDEVIVIA